MEKPASPSAASCAVSFNMKLDRRRMLRTYDRHPLHEQAILERVASHKQSPSSLTEFDLAVDHNGELTDQNHVGGLRAVVQLAIAAGVKLDSHVLDLGAGLGGSARVLASIFDCRVHCIELSPSRCREARHLTRLVGLEPLVKISCGDFLRKAFRPQQFDVLWLQGSWNHVWDKRKALRRWTSTLQPGGRVAIEDAFIHDCRVPKRDQRILYRLARQWHSDLRSISNWLSVLQEGGFEVICINDLSADLLCYYQSLPRHGPVDELERRSWADAIHLTRNKYIGYGRIIGRKVL
jgi:SAM-dependent methyltransferase